MSQGIPPSLKPVAKYVTYGKELEKVNPLVSYYCALFAVDKSLSICDRSDPAAKQFVSELLEECERRNAVVGGNKEDHRAEVETFALRVFADADDEDRAGNADKNTAKRFYAAATFLEVCETFGELPTDIAEKRRYAMKKTSMILQAISQGRRPEPGLPGSQPSGEEGVESSAPAEGEYGASAPSAPPPDASATSEPPPPASSSSYDVSGAPPPAPIGAAPFPNPYGQPAPYGAEGGTAAVSSAAPTLESSSHAAKSIYPDASAQQMWGPPSSYADDPQPPPPAPEVHSSSEAAPTSDAQYGYAGAAPWGAAAGEPFGGSAPSAPSPTESSVPAFSPPNSTTAASNSAASFSSSAPKEPEAAAPTPSAGSMYPTTASYGAPPQPSVSYGGYPSGAAPHAAPPQVSAQVAQAAAGAPPPTASAPGGPQAAVAAAIAAAAAPAPRAADEACIQPKPGFSAGMSDMSKAQKHAKNAASALDFQDTKSALRELKSALAAITGMKIT